MENEISLEKSKRNPLAEILSIGATCDGFSPVGTDPNGNGIFRSME